MKSKIRNKEYKLATLLTRRIAIVLFLIFFIMLLFLLNTTKRDLVSQEEEKIMLLARENANIVLDQINGILAKQQVVINVVNMVKHLEEPVKAGVLSELLQSINTEESGILNLFYIAEPDIYKKNTPNGYSIGAGAQGVTQGEDRYLFEMETNYQTIKEKKVLLVADPALKTIDGKQYQVITFLQPVLNEQGEFEGLVGSSLDTQILNNIKYQDGGYKTFQNQIVCAHNKIITNSRDSASIGKSYIEASVSKNPQSLLELAREQTDMVVLDSLKDGSKVYRAFVAFQVGNSPMRWLSGTSFDQKELNQQIFQTLLSIIGIIVVGLIILTIFCYYSILSKLKPLEQVVVAAEQLSEGNLQPAFYPTDNNEIRKLVGSLELAAKEIKGYVLNIDMAMARMAEGDFDVYPEKAFIGDFEGIEASITNFIKYMCKALSQIDQTAMIVRDGAEQVAKGSQELSVGAEKQETTMTSLTEVIDKLNKQVKDNDCFAKQAVQFVNEAAEQLTCSEERMENLQDAITQISEHSRQIRNIMQLIQDIASQTNLLALNASIEAARAGENGKGFAVIADEVRELATKSAEAVESTSGIIEASLLSVERGKEAAFGTKESLDIVKDKAVTVSDAVLGICEASIKQIKEIEQVYEDAEQIKSVIHSNTAVIQESMAVSQELASQAEALQELTSGFVLNKKLIPDIRGN